MYAVECALSRGTDLFAFALILLSAFHREHQTTEPGLVPTALAPNARVASRRLRGHATLSQDGGLDTGMKNKGFIFILFIYPRMCSTVIRHWGREGHCNVLIEPCIYVHTRFIPRINCCKNSVLPNWFLNKS